MERPSRPEDTREQRKKRGDNHVRGHPTGSANRLDRGQGEPERGFWIPHPHRALPWGQGDGSSTERHGIPGVRQGLRSERGHRFIHGVSFKGMLTYGPGFHRNERIHRARDVKMPLTLPKPGEEDGPGEDD